MKKFIRFIPILISFSVYIFFFHESSTNLVHHLMIAGYLAGALLVSFFVRKNDPGKGALIMGLGIVSLGPVHTMDFMDRPVKVVPFLLIGLWIHISISYLMNVKKWFKQDINQMFLYGTWVAASSVVGVSVLFYYPSADYISKTIAITGVFLWTGYVAMTVKGFKKIFHSDKQLGEIHGGILLTAVSTQSIVIVMEWTFNLIESIELLLLGVGITFYVLSMIILIKRYSQSGWTLVDDWKNTNCIIHGALSITGVSWLNIDTPTYGMIIYWFIVFVIFLLIELIELIRATYRVKLLGIVEGIAVYHPSQWARIFTFGMFYYFTSILNTYPSGTLAYLTYLQDHILSVLTPLIVVLTFLQLMVMGYPVISRIVAEKRDWDKTIAANRKDEQKL